MSKDPKHHEDREGTGAGRGRDYYPSEDHPTPEEKASMWTAVARSLPGAEPAASPGAAETPGDPRTGRSAGHASPQRAPAFHWKSFWLGQAAAVLLLLAVFGGYSLVQELAGDRAPDSDLQRTYRSSLLELASSAQFLAPPSSEQQQEALESRLRGLEEIDRMIEEIRSDMLLNGSTQAKRQQLRRLYATKLDFVQKLILTEEVSS